MDWTQSGLECPGIGSNKRGTESSACVRGEEFLYQLRLRATGHVQSANSHPKVSLSETRLKYHKWNRLLSVLIPLHCILLLPIGNLSATSHNYV